MPATPKTLRQAPQRRFENYTLSRVVSSDVGLANVPDAVMTDISGFVSKLGSPDTMFDIGFDFSFDGVLYKKIVINEAGWVALVDPTETNPANVRNAVMSSTSGSFDNTGILATNATQNALLCPWFDDLSSTTNNVGVLDGAIGDTRTNRISQGLEPPPAFYNQIEYGVKLYNDFKTPKGRRTIIRWTSTSPHGGSTLPLSSIIRFDVVLYENGRIEFCYVPRNALTLGDSAVNNAFDLRPDNFFESATIGIFMPGTNRFRDFALGLGHNDVGRKSYVYGGAAYDPSFFDAGPNGLFGDFISRSFVWRLRPSVHWPGLIDVGAMFVFDPPKNRRKVLPRNEQRSIDSTLSLPTVARTGDSRPGNKKIGFDDRRTINFIAAGLNSNGVVTGSLVNYPTTLQRFYGNSELEVIDRQDLFTSDFEFTGSIVKSSVDPFIGRNATEFIEPWSENKLFENDPSAIVDPFFSGSRIDLFGFGLQQPLRSKTKIKLSLPVNFTTSMFGLSSSIYYYNTKLGFWEVPQNSSYLVGTGSQFVADVDAHGQNGLGDLAPTNSSVGINRQIIEDGRGFGAIGNSLASGSHNAASLGDQTDPSIGAIYTAENVTIAVGKRYSKSVTNNENYKAVTDEILKLPINQPFLIEKAVIELPFAFGDGWFKDKTTSFIPLGSTGSFDLAGPALTIAIFNQYNLGSVTRRDLIMTGTITHTLDNISEVVFSNFPPKDNTFQLRPRGFKAFNSTPAAVVTPVSSSGGYRFTGSVTTHCVAGVSNGIVAKFVRDLSISGASLNRSGVISLFNTPEINLNSNGAIDNGRQNVNIGYINNIGRGGTGFDPSGRSAFGKEYVMPFGNVSRGGSVTNPFYLSGASGGLSFDNLTSKLTSLGLPQFAQAVLTGSAFVVQAAIPFEGHQPSPYLVRPGDTLILAISKTRPFCYATSSFTSINSSSIEHDIKLLTGTINITLYGSMLRENAEFHDPLNQPLASNAVHEVVIGNEPVLDQFETDYRDLYISGSYDDVIAGTLIKKISSRFTSTTIGFLTGNRGRVFSINDARSAPTPGTQLDDFSDSVSFRSQPYFEKAGSVRYLQISNPIERYWDSLMPDVNQCFAANGASIVVPKIGQSFGDINSVDQQTAFIIFDTPTDGVPLSSVFNDNNWTWGYPFEPRYSNATRQQQIQRSFIANYEFGGSPLVSSIPARAVRGFFVGPDGIANPSVPPNFPPSVALMTASVLLPELNLLSDAFLTRLTPSNHAITSSANVNDISKVLFGFGDLNNIMFGAATNITASKRSGTNHFADFRTRGVDFSFAPGVGYWSMSPIIRGWKYGVYSGLSAFSKAYFRQGRYGQLRDMLEQRPFTKFYQTAELDPSVGFQGALPAVVTVRFVDATGRQTQPENTWSQNLSFEATSSIPYIDGEIRNRQTINGSTLNAAIVSLHQTSAGVITL